MGVCESRAATREEVKEVRWREGVECGTRSGTPEESKQINDDYNGGKGGGGGGGWSRIKDKYEEIIDWNNEQIGKCIVQGILQTKYRYKGLWALLEWKFRFV